MPSEKVFKVSWFQREFVPSQLLLKQSSVCDKKRKNKKQENQLKESGILNWCPHILSKTCEIFSALSWKVSFKFFLWSHLPKRFQIQRSTCSKCMMFLSIFKWYIVFSKSQRHKLSCWNKNNQIYIYSLDCLKYYVALKTMFIERKNPILN
jgi:hypothetical protein